MDDARQAQARTARQRVASAEAALLKLLAAQPGKPVSREELARGLGLDSGNERGVDVQITRLRKKIEPEGKPQHIQTIRGAGYQLQGNYL